MFFSRIFQKIYRQFPKKHQGIKKYNLRKHQVYPEGKYFINSLFDYSNNVLKKIGFNKKNKIICIGTCFAEEIANYLSKNSKNYKIYEENSFKFSVNWGRVYTSSNLRQIINYSFNQKFRIYYRYGIRGYYDPLRDYACGTYETKKELIKSINKHRNLSKKVFSSCDHIFITLGQTEYWYDKNDKFIFGNTPGLERNFSEKINKDIFYKDETLKDMNNNIDFVIKILKKFNKKIKIIFTLSPVPSSATFFDENVILKSFDNKAKLKILLTEIIKKHSNVFYFPSFESVMLDNNNYLIDNRHVSSKKVKEIFNVFKNFF